MFTFVPPDMEGEKDDNNVTDDQVEEMERHSGRLPQFCTDVVITARRHPQSYLSSPPPIESLPILQESFFRKHRYRSVRNVDSLWRRMLKGQ